MELELQSLGLTKNDAKIFIAINELGLCTTTNISKKTKIHRANIYDGVQSLVDKGLISYVLKGTTKYFQANNPNRILLMIKEKEDIAKSLVPRLELLQQSGVNKSRTSIQEGLVAAKRAMDSFLEHENSEILVMGVSTKASQLIKPFLTNFHKRRIGKKVVMKHIYNTDATERMEILSKMDYTEVRILPSKFNSPVATNIVGNEVIMIRWDKNAKVITIKNKEIAEAYRNYFNLMWKDAKEPKK